jgi:hypothetical protein
VCVCVRTFSLASLMQLWKRSIIWSLLRQGSGGGEEEVEAAVLRRLAAARAARACARSSSSSLETRKKGLIGDRSLLAATGDLGIGATDGLGLASSSAIDERERERELFFRGKFLKGQLFSKEKKRFLSRNAQKNMSAKEGDATTSYTVEAGSHGMVPFFFFFN